MEPISLKVDIGTIKYIQPFTGFYKKYVISFSNFEGSATLKFSSPFTEHPCILNYPDSRFLYIILSVDMSNISFSSNYGFTGTIIIEGF